MSEERRWKLLRWSVRAVNALVLLLFTVEAYQTAAKLPSDRQRAAHLAFVGAGLAVLAGWSALRLSVFLHPRADEWARLGEVSLPVKIAAAVLIVTVVTAQGSAPTLWCAVAGGVSGTAAAGIMFPAMFLVRRRIREWRPRKGPKRVSN